MVAEANFVTTEPGNIGDDVFGHGTWVASVALSSDAINTGFAPDARYVNARVLDSGVGFANDVQVRNGIGFAIDQGADILNLSLNYNATFSSGFSPLDLMLDWAAYARGVNSAVAVGNIPVDPNSPPAIRCRVRRRRPQSGQLVQRHFGRPHAARLFEGQPVQRGRLHARMDG